MRHNVYIYIACIHTTYILCVYVYCMLLINTLTLTLTSRQCVKHSLNFSVCADSTYTVGFMETFFMIVFVSISEVSDDFGVRSTVVIDEMR